MNHVISFRRPGQTHVLTKLTVPPEEDATAYVRRLEDLGYKVVEVSPSVCHETPPQDQLAPELKVID